MRLISCHIENFGKLHDFDMTFSDGLNVVCRENGWGKTTLAAFIKAMLYGLDGERKHSIEENERKRFSPWQGGIFGGRLDFVSGGKKYSVTRTFGESPSKDTFELRDIGTNLVSRDFSDRLGEELFRLNSASYYRSIFFGQNDCPTVSTDDIHAKIGDLADNTGDMNSYEAAETRLAKQINRLSPNRVTGSVYLLSLETAELRRRVAEGNRLDEMIAENEKENAQTTHQKRLLIDKKSDLERTQKRAILLHKLSIRRGEWERLKKASSEAKNDLEAAESLFPNGVPGEETIRSSLHKAVEMKSAECLMTSYELSEEEENKLEDAKRRFDSHPPVQEEIERYLGEEQELRRISEKHDRLRLNSEERKRLDYLISLFASDDISPDELAARWNERAGKLHALSSKRDALDAVTESYGKYRKSSRRRSAILIAAGILLLAVGAVLFMLFSNIWLLSVSVAGGFAVAMGILSSVISRMTKTPDEMLRLRNDIGYDEGVIEQIGSTIAEYLTSHGKTYSEQFACVMLQELSGDRRDLDMLVKKSESAESFLSNSRFNELSESIKGYLSKYSVIPDDKRLSDQLYELRESALEYEQLKAKKEKYYESEQNYASITLELKNYIASIGYDAGESIPDTLQQIRDRVSDYLKLRQQYSSASAELSAFEKSVDTGALASFAEESLPSLESVAEEISACSEEIERLSESLNSIKKTGEELNEAFSRWEDDKSALAEKTKQLESERKKYQLLKRTKELLRRAKEQMTAKYIEPVSSGFRRYYELLSGEPSDNYLIDADIRVTVEKQGRQRETEALSAGYRDLTGICLRLALVDAMYRGEKPTLIMDDPFTNLDDEKTAASAKLLYAVSESYQIIYFTCSASRSAT